jgi:hypothetical protein
MNSAARQRITLPSTQRGSLPQRGLSKARVLDRRTLPANDHTGIDVDDERSTLALVFSSYLPGIPPSFPKKEVRKKPETIHKHSSHNNAR